MIDLVGAGLAREGTTLLPPTTLAIRRGEAVVVRGPNGAGKTTVLRLIGGRLIPSCGKVTVLGATPQPRDPAFRAHVAAMVGLPPFARDLTLLEHATLVAVTWGASVAAGRASAVSLLDALGLRTLQDRFPHELSSGQTQLAGLALTLARPADVLLLDEPEQRLDDARLARLLTVLRQRRDAGCTIVAATHSDEVQHGIDARGVTLQAAA